MKEGPRRSAGASSRSSATSTRDATRRRRRATSASATSPAQAERRPDLPARRRRERARFLVARAPRGSSSRTGARPASRRLARRRSGRSAQVTVRAPQVVVACGALESPALLLRSRIGGPAVGDYLRLHPSRVFGATARTSRPGGARRRPASRRVRRHRRRLRLPDRERAVHDRPGRLGDAVDVRRDHKELMADFRFSGDVHLADARPRPRAGRDRRERRGGAVLLRSTTSSTSRTCTRGSRAGPAARGGRRGQIASLAAGPPSWRRGDDLERSSTRSSGSRSAPAATGCSPPTRWAPAGWATTPQTSVAEPFGELHDTKGVWIGDGSAFPTASGTNPMVTIMALAHRTAEAIAADAGKPVSDADDSR